MSISRSQLIGKKVYNPDGGYVGDVMDLGLAIGSNEITLIVRTAAGTELTIEWSKVGAAKDIIILKEAVEVPEAPAQPTPSAQPGAPPAAPVQPPVQPPAAPQPPVEEKKGFSLPFLRRKSEEEAKICPSCGQPATWIPQYQRWYCYNCQRYVE